MALQLDQVTLGYSEHSVAGPISISVPKREVLAIVGPSGCGKTTLLKAISGELPVKGGEIRLEGHPRGREWLSSHLVRTLQNFPLLHWLTVEGNLKLAARIKGLPPPDTDRILTEFSALHLKCRFPRTLSGGERCRASIAQAAISRPKVLLLDEPFTGLDFNVKEEVAQVLFSFCERHSSTIMFVTHDLNDACRYAHRILVMGGGSPSRILKEIVGTPTEALDAVRHAFLSASGAC